ncbi:hypothetical protein [Spirosoma utsteinense]|uniref:ABC transporter ATPase n=1 Tax=Spirosoma utsteinense TaxID=2585773 RepID=A0ABR6W409_9BACT|nr:hypothetical protein [Spirosoma utsteinense]MBC3788030.1 hypothetical protein [Spirosoma utsteinense]MBC3791268.1 hypothetical protein [Spirosoma utsteinense]
MWIDFDKLPDNARVWVYQANRPLLDSDINAINEALQPALSQWAAHGQALLASAKVIENRFVIVGVDEGYNLPSGCSIDSSVRTLRQLGESLSIDFFDRSAAIMTPEEMVQTIELPVLKTAVSTGIVTPETMVFNTLVKTKAEFLTNWHLRAGDTWLKRYFKTTLV